MINAIMNPFTGNFPYQDFRQTQAYMRFINAVPGSPSVDVYLNENLFARQIPYRGFTPYFKLPAGSYNMRVFRAGTTVNPLINTQINLPAGTITTTASIGNPGNMEIFGIPDNIFATSPGMSYLRFVHLSPDTPAVNVTYPNGNVIFDNIEYKQITNYIAVAPGTYTLQLRQPGTNRVILHVPNIRVLPGRILSVYLVGLTAGNPPLQALIPLDGNTYIKDFY